MYSAKLKAANATENDKCVNAGYPCISNGLNHTDKKLTSKVIPGTNITTAKAWKNFRRAFTLNVGNF